MSFPAARRRRDCIDLTGNVWDWTGSLYQPYPYVADDGREDPAGDARRVVRGGSWGSDQTDARAACRDVDAPDDRDLRRRVSAGVLVPHPRL